MILELPNAAWAIVLKDLDVESLLRLASVCHATRNQVFDDTQVWKPLCATHGIHKFENYGTSSFRELHTRLLHQHAPLFGLWKADTSPVGTMLVVHPDDEAGTLKFSSVLTRRLNGKALVRDIFLIRLDPGSLSPQGYAVLESQTEAQPRVDLEIHSGCTNSDSDSDSDSDSYNAIGVTGFTVTYPENFEYDVFEVLPRVVTFNHLGRAYHLPSSVVEQLLPPPAALQEEGGEEAGEEGGEQQWPDVPLPSHVLHQFEQFSHMHNTEEQLRAWEDREEHNVVRFSRLSVPQGHHVLEGLWRGCYGGHGVEILCLARDEEQPVTLEAVKVTGDVNIPAGEVSFIIYLDEPLSSHPEGVPFALPPDFRSRVDLEAPGAGRLVEYARYKAVGQIASTGFRDSNLIDIQALQFGRDCFGLLWGELCSFSIFTRLQL